MGGLLKMQARLGLGFGSDGDLYILGLSAVFPFGLRFFLFPVRHDTAATTSGTARIAPCCESLLRSTTRKSQRTILDTTSLWCDDFYAADKVAAAAAAARAARAAGADRSLPGNAYIGYNTAGRASNASSE